MSTGVVPEAIRDAAYDAAVLSCGILISESLTEFSTDPKQAKKLSDAAPDAKAAMDELLTACAEKAPQLLKEESFVLPLARLSAWAPAADWVRPLDDWSCDTSSSAAGALRSLEEHLLETYESPKALHTAVAHRPPEGQCTENAHRIACAFTRVLADAGAGRTSVRAALQREVCPGITKRMAKEFVQLDPATAASARCAAGKAGSKGSDENPPGAQVPLSPLHALREAQVLALGGDAWVVRAACAARMGSVLGTAMEEEFCLTALMWLCTHQEELDEIAQATTILDYFCEMHAADGDFAVAGRTVKRVLEAIEQYALSTITFDNDEQFQGNPKGLTGMFMENATIPAGTKLAVPYDEPAYGGHGTYKLGGEGQRGSEPVTVRIAEIKSLKRLVYEVRAPRTHFLANAPLVAGPGRVSSFSS